MHDAFELLNRHVTVSRETFERLSIYHDLLLRWQPKINLVGKDTISNAWGRHFLDALQLVPQLPDKNTIILDIGTGAGFPGMVLAIFGYHNIHLVDSDARKIAFLREVARLTNTQVTIHHNRIEKISIRADMIVSRALASLEELLSFSSHIVPRGTNCLFHKGKNYTKEIEDAKTRWQFDIAITPSITDQQGVILRLSNLRENGYDTEKSNA